MLGDVYKRQQIYLDQLHRGCLQAIYRGPSVNIPFPFLLCIVITFSNDQFVNCVINIFAIQLFSCPPANDNCSGSIEAVVNTDQSCLLTTSGTLAGASPSGNSSSCLVSADDDVWYDFVALSEVQLISLVDISGTTTSLGHALYVGTGDVDLSLIHI